MDTFLSHKLNDVAPFILILKWEELSVRKEKRQTSGGEQWIKKLENTAQSGILLSSKIGSIVEEINVARVITFFKWQLSTAVMMCSVERKNQRTIREEEEEEEER